MLQSPIEPEPWNGACESDTRDYVEYILIWMKAHHLSIRALEGRVKRQIKRSRLQKVLHRNPDRRLILTISEWKILLDAMGINHLEAEVSISLIRRWPEIGVEDFSRLAMMVAVVFNGLPERLFGLLSDLRGFALEDVNASFGHAVQNQICTSMVEQFTDLIERKDRRLGL